MGQDAGRWALPRVSVACVREHPGHAAELGTQVLMGMPLKVLSVDGDWVRIEAPDGYRGYVIANSLQLLSDDDMALWRRRPRVVVVSVDQTYVYGCDGDAGALNRLSDVVNGCVLEQLPAVVDDGEDGFVAVRLPDGRCGFMRPDDVEEIGAWAGRTCRKETVLAFARMLMGTPYLWGGTSTKAMDCSGLTKIAYLSQGVILPRNASQQAKVGTAIEQSDVNGFAPGDMLLFGNRRTGRVNHVGMSLGGGRFIHCSGRVKINSLDKGDEDYAPLELLSVRRLDDADLRRMSVWGHPWYF